MKFACLALTFLFADVWCAETALQRFEFSEPHMGTLYRILLYAPDDKTANAASAAAFQRITQLDEMLTDYNDDSELMKLCEHSGGPPVPVSADLYEVIERSLALGRMTNGAFDITVGPVVMLWRRARRHKELPDPQDLAAAMKLVGLQNVVLHPESHAIELKLKGMRLDLGGIAKGFAVDKALKILSERGITRALVIGGGDTGVSDPPPGTDGWAVEVQALPASHPNANDASKKTILLLKNSSVSTSGDQFQHLDLAGKRYSHVIDPKSGQALEGRRSVSVVAPDTTTSDALAKLCVLPADKAIEIIDTVPGTALLYAQEIGNEIVIHASGKWAELPKK